MAFEASFPGVCGSCYKDLGYTPTGKPRKGDFCKSYLNRMAFEKLPQDEQRRHNRERQANRRKKHREKEAGDGRRGRGEGTITEVSPGNWRGAITFGTAASGKRIRRVVYAKTKHDLQEKMRKLASDADSGRITDADGLTAAQYLNRWLEMVKPSLKPATSERYEGLAEHLLSHLGKMKLAKLQPIHVEHALTELAKVEGVSTWTRRKCGGMLSTALKHAVTLKLIPSNPAPM